MDNNLVKLEYEPLEWENHGFDSDSIAKINALLTIVSEGNVLYICHPKHLLDVIIEDSDTKEISAVDFDSINLEKMIGFNDFGKYSIVEQICKKEQNQFTYFMKRATHMMKKYRSEGTQEFSYPLVVLEEIYREYEPPQYFVRGIMKCNQNGFSLAFNPQATKTLREESVWERALRFGDNYK